MCRRINFISLYTCTVKLTVLVNNHEKVGNDVINIITSEDVENMSVMTMVLDVVSYEFYKWYILHLKALDMCLDI